DRADLADPARSAWAGDDRASRRDHGRVLDEGRVGVTGVGEEGVDRHASGRKRLAVPPMLLERQTVRRAAQPGGGEAVREGCGGRLDDRVTEDPAHPNATRVISSIAACRPGPAMLEIT